MNTFERLESNVRSYCRAFPVVITSARGSLLEDEEGNTFIDFLSGAGVLNYGHNNPDLKAKLIEYLESDGITHSLDMYSSAKAHFLDTFDRLILQPRRMSYRLQFPGPTGTNAVEAALKLARTITSRNSVISFSNAFHGMTSGALAATGNEHHRNAAGTPLTGVTFMPYDGYLGDEVDTTEYLEKVLADRSSGVDLPAAVIVETVQGEGGVNVASFQWLRALEAVCRRHGIVLIVDDIQVGCGRTGTFFSFEKAGISPDIILLSKSLSAYGIPLSVVLMKPELDQWEPGQHNGTFRGHNLAFVTAAAALEKYWGDDRFSKDVTRKAALMSSRLKAIASRHGDAGITLRGRGMILALVFEETGMASRVSAKAFEKGMIIETCGAEEQVLKCLPPLTIEDDLIEQAMKILEESINEVRYEMKSDAKAKQPLTQEGALR